MVSLDLRTKHLCFAGLVLPLLLSRGAGAELLEFDEKQEWVNALPGEFTTIDFTGFEDNTPITDQYAHLGVHFTTFDVISDCNCHVNDGWGLQGFDEIVIEFDHEMQWIAMDFPGVVQLEIWNDGRLIGESNWFGGPGPGQFGGIISSDPFDAVRIIDPVSGAVDLDDFHFGPPIPGPGVLGIFTAAAFGGVGRRRIRR